MRVLCAIPALLCAAAQAGELDAGFRLLYHLRFAEARAEFARWREARREDPMGRAAEAASHLFEEFERHGVLTTEFFLDDDLLLNGIRGKADAAAMRAFHEANGKARELAAAALARDPRDARALLALVLAAGMEADAASLIEKRQVRALKLIREAEELARRLLEAAPDAFDGYFALGAASYIVACLPAYKRALLWLGGVRGDKTRGMEQLRLAAQGGNYLRPYAKMMLALALLRERQAGEARTLIAELAGEFPGSPLFARELRKMPLAPPRAGGVREGGRQ